MRLRCLFSFFSLCESVSSRGASAAIQQKTCSWLMRRACLRVRHIIVAPCCTELSLSSAVSVSDEISCTWQQPCLLARALFHCIRLLHFCPLSSAAPAPGDISSTDGSMQLPNNSSDSSSQQESPGQHTVWIPDALQAAAPGAPAAAWREEAATVRA